MPYRKLTILAVVILLFSIGHHVDHIIRGNHVGWPLIDQITPFTYSLGFYPLIAVAFYLWARGKVGPWFWSMLAWLGLFFVGLVHFGPFAAEPPQDILEPYRFLIAGWFAIAWLLVLLLLLSIMGVYSFIVWRHKERTHSVAARRSTCCK